MGIISNMVQNVVTIYGLLFLCWCTFVPQPVTSPPRSLPIAHTNRPSNPAADAVRRPTPPASPESWRPHVQTARPSEHSFSREHYPTRNTWPQNLCVPYASAVTYAR